MVETAATGSAEIGLSPGTGRVVAVCLGETRAFPKLPRESVEIGPYGLVGDAHATEQRWSRSQRANIPNDRAVSLLADEVRLEINGLLGLDLQPGDFNENILIAGLGDLGDLARGDVLLFSSGVVLCISEQNPPCAQLEAHGGAGLIKATSRRDEGGAIRNKRGIVATVVQTGRLSPGDTCSLRRHV